MQGAAGGFSLTWIAKSFLAMLLVWQLVLPAPAQQVSASSGTARQQPESAGEAVKKGEYFFRHQRWNESADWLSKAYSLTGESEKIGYELAYARLQAGNLQSAKQLLQGMSQRSDTARVHSLLGAVEEQEKNYSDAAHEYYRAAEIDPSESNLFDLANLLLQHKQYVGYLPESVKFFRYGVSKYPKSAKLRVGLGVALYASDDYDEAVSVLCQAVDLAPNDPRPLTFLGMARKVSPELAKQVDSRLKDFAQRYPKNAAASYEYALSLWERGGGELGQHLAQIETLLRQAIASAPQWYEPHYQLGLVYESEKRYREAIQEMRKASTLEPAFGPAHFRLAVLYKRVGDGAHAAQESALARRLNNAEIKDSMLQEAGK